MQKPSQSKPYGFASSPEGRALCAMKINDFFTREKPISGR